MDDTVRGILQATVLEWVVFPFPQGIFSTQESNPGLPQADSLPTELSRQHTESYSNSLFLTKTDHGTLPHPVIPPFPTSLHWDSFSAKENHLLFHFLLHPLDLCPLSIFPLRSPNSHLPCENSTSPFRSNHTLSALGSFPGDAAVFHCSLLLHLFLCITVCQLLLCKVFGEKFLSYSESNSRTLNSSRHIVGAQLKHRFFFFVSVSKKINV